MPLKDQNAVIYRCAWEDLAIVSISPDAIPNLEFFDAKSQRVDPMPGETVHCLGFPTDFGQLVEKKMVGNKEERTIA